MEQELIKLGLSEKEAKVYLALLELSEETVQNIATKAKVNRATTYVILEKLMKLGLTSQVERDKKTYFIAEDPSELVNILEAEKRQIDARKKNLDAVMNQLQAIHNRNQEKPTVRFFEGADGLEALDRIGFDQTQKGDEMLAFSPVHLIEKYFSTRRATALNERVKKGIRSRIIYTRAAGPFDEQLNAKELRTAKYMEIKDFPIDISLIILPGTGIKLFHYDINKPFGVLVQSPAIAENFRHIFELAWKGVDSTKKSNE